MIYELREYVAASGAADRLHERFADHTLALFQRHGLELIGFWQDRDEPGRIVYLLAFEGEDERTRAWDAFKADEEWQRVKRESETAGPVTAELHSRVLVAPDYFDSDARLRAG